MKTEPDSTKFVPMKETFSHSIPPYDRENAVRALSTFLNRSNSFPRTWYWLLVFGGILLSSVSALASTPVADTIFIFKNAYNGRCLTPSNRGKSNGTVVRQWDCKADFPHQKWKLTKDGQLTDQHSGKCLTPANGATRDGTALRLWSCDARRWPHQKWRFDVAKKQLINVKSGRCLTPQNGASAKGNGVAQRLWGCSTPRPHAQHQGWIWTPVCPTGLQPSSDKSKCEPKVVIPAVTFNLYKNISHGNSVDAPGKIATGKTEQQCQDLCKNNIKCTSYLWANRDFSKGKKGDCYHRSGSVVGFAPGNTYINSGVKSTTKTLATPTIGTDFYTYPSIWINSNLSSYIRHAGKTEQQCQDLCKNDAKCTSYKWRTKAQIINNKTYPAHDCFLYPGSSILRINTDSAWNSGVKEVLACAKGLSSAWSQMPCLRSLCTKGTFRVGNSCNKCPAGTYWIANNQCKKCKAGTSSTMGSTSVAACTRCPEGTYAAIEGAAKCTPCAKGTYSHNTYGSDRTKCLPCRLQTYCPSEGTKVPTKCPSGYEAPVGSKLSSDCFQKKYRCLELTASESAATPRGGGLMKAPRRSLGV